MDRSRRETAKNARVCSLRPSRSRATGGQKTPTTWFERAIYGQFVLHEAHPRGINDVHLLRHFFKPPEQSRDAHRQRPGAEHRPGAGLCQPRRATLQTAAASPRSLCRAARSSAWRACVSAVWRRPRDPLESAPTTRCLTVQPRFRAAHQAPSYSRTPRITGSQSL